MFAYDFRDYEHKDCTVGAQSEPQEGLAQDLHWPRSVANALKNVFVMRTSQVGKVQVTGVGGWRVWGRKEVMWNVAGRGRGSLLPNHHYSHPLWHLQIRQQPLWGCNVNSFRCWGLCPQFAAACSDLHVLFCRHRSEQPVRLPAAYIHFHFKTNKPRKQHLLIALYFPPTPIIQHFSPCMKLNLPHLLYKM